MLDALMPSGGLTIAAMARRAERLFGHKPVISHSPAGRSATTFGELLERARRVGPALDRLGVRPDATVATLAWNSGHHLELYVGVPGSGRVLHTLNPRQSPRTLADVLVDGRAETLVVARSLLGLGEQVAALAERPPALVVIDDGSGPEPGAHQTYESLLADVAPAEWVDVDERRAASVCHTGGTTGRPRGVVYSHRSLYLHAMSTLAADVFAISERDTVLPIVPMFHANAVGLPHAALLAGSTLVLGGSDNSGQAIAGMVAGESVTVAIGVVAIWAGALEAMAARGRCDLRLLVSGASAVPPTLSRAYEERVGIPITQIWGMTETSPLGTISRPTTARPADEPGQREVLRTSIGTPVVGMEARIVDDDGGPVPADGTTAGELQVRGPCVTTGYLGVGSGPDAFTADGWLRTGDVATSDELGYLRIVDRAKDLIKSGGEWISSVDVEQLLAQHPDVVEIAVVAIPDERFQERPLACVVPRPGTAPDLASLHAVMADETPTWWRPDAVVLLDDLPRTSTNKVDKRALRDRYADPVARSTS